MVLVLGGRFETLKADKGARAVRSGSSNDIKSALRRKWRTRRRVQTFALDRANPIVGLTAIGGLIRGHIGYGEAQSTSAEILQVDFCQSMFLTGKVSSFAQILP